MPTFKTNLKTRREQMVRIPQSEVGRLLDAAAILDALNKDEDVRNLVAAKLVEHLGDKKAIHELIHSTAEWIRDIPKLLAAYQVKRDGKAKAAKTT